MPRTIIVTGASKGIGRAAATFLAADGWSVIGLARTAPAHFPGAFIEVDLGDPAATQAVADQFARRPDITGIVNNAGAARSENFGAVDPTAMLDMIAFNLRAALTLTLS